MLRACRRILRPKGRTAFTTIVVSPGLSKPVHRRAVRLGPRAIASTRPVDVLVTAAGFVDVGLADVTSDFLETARAWLTEFHQYESELRRLLGGEYVQREIDRRDLITGIEEGLVRRVLVAATAPAR